MHFFRIDYQAINDRSLQLTHRRLRFLIVPIIAKLINKSSEEVHNESDVFFMLQTH